MPSVIDQILWCLLHSSSWFIRFPRELGGRLDIHLLYSWILWSYLRMLPFPCAKSIQAGRKMTTILSGTTLQTFFPSSLLMSRLDRREDIGFSAILSQLSPLTLEHLPLYSLIPLGKRASGVRIQPSLAAKARKGSDLTVCPMFSLVRCDNYITNPGIV